jgi:hypothetical protein
MEKENSFRNAIIFGVFIVTHSILGSMKYHDVVKGIFYGILVGFCYSAIITIVITIMGKVLYKKAPDNCIFTAKANHLLNNESVGGMLYLCENDMIFQSHKFNWTKEKFAINYNEIYSVNFGRFPGSIKIVLSNSDEFSFIVNKKNVLKKWIEDKIK